MKSKKSSLRAALFLALIGAAFAFTACWQGTPAGGDNLPDVTENGGKTSDGDKSEILIPRTIIPRIAAEKIPEEEILLRRISRVLRGSSRVMAVR